MTTNRRTRLDGLCCRCKRRKARENQSYCRECTNEMFREYRREDPAITARHRARAIARRAMLRGEITPEPCSVCGRRRAEMHHPDHRKPLDVVWLCRRHHAELRRKA